jgi:hypothetical protein
MNRRSALGSALGLASVPWAMANVGCRTAERETGVEGSKIDPVLGVEPLEFVWKTLDPFLFCVHHEDRYTKANPQFGPAVWLCGGVKCN